jgi:hypothetical protein
VTGADSAADRFSLQAGSTAATAATTRAAGKSKLSSWGAKGAKAWSQLKGGLSKVSGAAGREHEAGGSGEEEEGEEEDASTRGRLSAGVEEEEEYGEGEEEEDDEEAALLPKVGGNLTVETRPAWHPSVNISSARHAKTASYRKVMTVSVALNITHEASNTHPTRHPSDTCDLTFRPGPSQSWGAQ